MTTMAEFEESGSLERPGPIGRLVRLLLGAFSVYVTIAVISGDPSQASVLPSNAGFWIGVAVGLRVFPYVINIGFTRDWGWRPLIAIALLAVAAAASGLVFFDRIWAPPVAWLIYVWLLYTYGHLGLSFLLAALLGTPGCEMRAVPDLFARISGRQALEHHCPIGPLSPIDRWESRRRQQDAGREME